MKNLLIALILVFGGQFCQAQSCNYAGAAGHGQRYPASPYAKQVVLSICKTLGVPYIETVATDRGNAFASHSYGIPIIGYNEHFMGYLQLHNQCAPISVMAHEVGHHLNMDLSWYGSFKHPWTRELQADFVSGYVLAKMGCSLYDAQSAFRVMFAWMGSASHPDTPRRMAAMQQGYQQALMGN
ncbi:M48 family metalloprotease [Cyclobacterium plantarum]|uniref:Peptidase M48 domain-containing protein n=1 Tax=Cyclobacterium plantarum TaxID=2716263 RepID=A0ABX0HBG1_9BACT|nr:hypothetical protein [Cyclobacterium plantarum]NHE58977.1 hypothetical protein [Cyclobacterium plantarum]